MRRSSLTVVGCLGVVLLGQPVAARPPQRPVHLNFIQNPGFEYVMGSGPAGWKLASKKEGGSLSEDAHSGKWSVALAAPNGEWPSAEQQVRLLPGQTYVLSFWHKAEGAGGGDPEVMLLGKGWKADFYVKGSPRWKRYFYLITPKVSSFKLILTNYHRKGRTFYFDDLSIDTNLAALVELVEPAGTDKPVANNTPTFRWRPEIARKHLTFDLLYSRSRTLPRRATVVAEGLEECTEHTPFEPLEDGRWFWKVRFHYNDLRRNLTSEGESEVASFRLASDGKDHRAPEITGCGPRRITDARGAEISISYKDNPGGSGIDPGRTVLQIDGAEVTSQAQVADEGVVYKPAALNEAVHTGEVTIADKSGNTATKKWWFLVKSRPAEGVVGWDPDKKIFLVDGKPFFPFGMYQFRMANPNPYFAYRKWGFNTAQFYDGEPIPGVKQASEAGVKVFAVHPFNGGTKNEWNLFNEDIPFEDPTVAPVIAQRVFEGCNLPGLFCWSMSDEPDGKPISRKRLRRLHEFVKGLDPYHLTDVVLMDYGAYYAYRDVADLIVGDKYPYNVWTGNDKPDTIWDEPIHQDRAQGGKKPVLTVLQHFGGRKGTSFPHVVPCEARRFMAYLAYIHGTRGMMWYAYGSSDYDSKNFPEQWEAMKALAKEFETMSPVLLGKDAEEKVLMRVVNPPNQKDRAGNPAIHFLMKEHEGKLYLITVNAAKEPVRAAFRVAAPLESVVEIPARREVTVSGRQMFGDSYKGFDVHVYEICLSRPPRRTGTGQHAKKPSGRAATGRRPAWRTWTDRSGRYNIEAVLEDFRDGEVHLRKRDGSLLEVPLERLSKADRQYVQQRETKQGPR